ncbi:MAG: hypothetical protein IM638_18245, partial [Bacteroidetes bacterium]|nr:hypothetical protein [Bacteroidota bacterium]
MADSYYFTNNDLMKTQIFSENLEYTSYSGSNRQKTTMKKTMTQKTTKSILIYFNLFVLFFLPFILNAQLTGVKNIPGDYATLADAITDLNNVGVGAGGTTLNIIGGNPQTAPVGGYQITASGTSVNPIIIQGNTNTITAFSPQPLGSLSDAIFKIIGGDYITITGLTIQENPSNIINNPGGNIMTEWAIALFYASPTNGAQNNTIINNQISLNRLHPNSWAIYSSVRHTSNLSFVDITSISGSNFNNKIYSNSISNVNFGIAFIGSPTASLMDIGNDIGGTSLSTGNTIVNWGGSATTLIQYPSNTTSNYCILMNHQTGDNVSFNTIQSAPNLTMSANTNFYGIYKAYTSVSPIGIFTININHNKLTMTGAVANRTLEHIRSEGLINLPAAIININNNLIINSAITGISTSGMISGINNLSSPGIININNNIIQNLSTTATTGNVRGISNDGSLANTTNVNINNNQFGNTSGGFITYVNANSGNLVAISSLSGTAVTNLSITGNDIRGINQTIPSTTSFYFIQTGNNALTLTISNNTFTSLIINTNQNICFFKTSTVFPSGGSQIVSNNAIVGSFVNNGGGGFITIFEDGVGSPSTTTQLISGNNFSNITSTGTTTILGWETRNGFSNKTIVNNTFTNWTGGSGETTVMLLAGISNGSTVNNNVINQITSEAKITGIRVLSGGVSATTARITDNTISNLNSISTGGDVIGLLYSNSSNEVLLEKNTIHTLSSTGIASVTGISLSQGNPVTVSKNKIYSLSGSNPSSIISGITTSAGSLITINNNLIGNLSAPATNSTNGIIGVNITGGSTVNVYFNTIYLNGSSTGNNFGSSGIYAITSSIVDMQNNLIVNLSSSTGSGLTTAYRRSSSLLTNYAATSNNNSFYAGIPSATNLIFHDGTNSDQTLASYKTRVSSRDNASVSENPVFVSTNGASSGFLHIPFGSSYFLESAGSTIIGVSSDYDNDVRPGPVGSVNGGATAPDIGADEYDGISLLICAGSPSSGTASISPLSNCSSGTFTLSLTGASSGPSITYQWQSSASSGGPYTNIAGATSPTYTTSTINSTTYFVCVVTCTTSGQSTTSIEITGLINPSPVVTAGASPLIICSGATTTLSSSGANTYVWSPGNISGSSVSVSPTITTTYTVLGTNALTGCTNTASVLVTVTPAPSLSVSATSTVICQGSFTTLSATGANTYLWNPGSLNGSFISVSPTTTTTYTVTGTNTVTGCSNSQTITITVNPPPTITTSTLTPFICIGSSAILNASGASTYVWNPGNLSGGSITVTPTSTTTYTVTGTNSITGCSSTQTLLITVNPLPTITTLSSLPTVCNGNPVSLSATGANTYVWNPGNLTGSSVSVTPTSTTTYTVTGTNTLTGCSNMQTLAVTVLPTPTVTANATSNSICFGGSTSLNANGADTYVWIPGSLTGSVVSVSPTVTTTYTVIGTNSLTGCSNTATITITVNTPPTVTASAVATTICSGGSTILSASGADTYVWSPGNLSGSSVSVSPSTTTTYTVTGTNNFTGCSNTAISTITVSSLPIVSTSLSASPICLGNSAILSASGANTYTWNPGNQNGASISVSPTSSTTYTVIGTNTSTGCINTATTTIIVNPLPLVNANASIPNICSGGSATLSATGATNFVWNPGNLNSASVNVSPTSTTTYTVTGTNASTGCTNTATTTISVNPLPIITAVSSVSVICVGESTTLTASGGDIYVWSPGNLSGSSVNVSPTVTTSYTVTGINTLTGCTNTATVTITVNPLPSVSATSFASSICLGSSTTLIASGASTYVWNPGNQSGASVIVSPTSTTTYTVTGTNTVTGCVNTQTLLVTVNPLPQLTTTSSVPAICIGDQVTLNASGASSYVWNPGNQSGASVIVSPTSTTMYTVTGTNIVTSCVNTQTLLVTVNPLPQLTTTSSVPAICIGDQVTLNATGASTYVWSPGNQSGASVIVSPTSTTTYTVTGTNTVTGCVNTQTLLVTVNPLPQLTTTSSVPAICIGDQVTLNA